MGGSVSECQLAVSCVWVKEDFSFDLIYMIYIFIYLYNDIYIIIYMIISVIYIYYIIDYSQRTLFLVLR